MISEFGIHLILKTVDGCCVGLLVIVDTIQDIQRVTFVAR
jgi:hypothetical protein